MDIDKYYEECRNGKLIRTEEGFIAVSQLKSSTLTVEHIWVKPECRQNNWETKLLKLAETDAKKRSLRYLEVCINLHTKLLMTQHRFLVDLGFRPVETRHDELVYEKLLGA